MYTFTVGIQLRVALLFSTVYTGQIVPSVCNLKYGWRYAGRVGLR
jgi:hypothetical protein